MGCTSSVATKVEDQSKNAFKIPTIQKDDDDDKSSEISSIAPIQPFFTDEDIRRLSVLTVRNGNISCQAVTHNGSPKVVLRDVASGLPVNTPQPSVRGYDTPVISQFTNGAPHLNTSKQMSPAAIVRPMKHFNLVAPNQYNSWSTPTSPQMKKLKKRRESDGRSSAMELRGSKGLNESQRLLNQALKDLSRSLSESHGDIFALAQDGDNRASRASVSPATSRISTYSLLNDLDANVVLDIGSGFCKAGLSNEDMPSVVVPTIVGRPKSPGVLPGVPFEAKFIGHEAKLRKDALVFASPVRRGVVQNWDEWTAVVDHVLNMKLQLDRNEFGIVLPHSIDTNKQYLEKSAEMLFENQHVSRIFQARSGPMALHAFGMTSGILVSIGHDVSSCVPVLQGSVITGAMRHLPVGGSDIAQTLKMLMTQQKPNRSSYQNFFQDDDIIKAIMERLCYAMYDEEKDTRSSPRPRTYSLPTGGKVNLDRERFLATEILFKPKLFGDRANLKGLQQICSESIEACCKNLSEDETKNLCRNMVLVGGTSLLPGIPQRLKSDLLKIVPWLQECDIEIHSPQKRQYAEWRGAAMMSSLSSTKCRWTTRAEYEEHGVNIVHRKYL